MAPGDISCRDLQVELQANGQAVQDSDVLNKGVALCRHFGLSPADLMTKWEVFVMDAQDERAFDVAGLDALRKYMSNKKQKTAHDGGGAAMPAVFTKDTVPLLQDSFYATFNAAKPPSPVRRPVAPRKAASKGSPPAGNDFVSPQSRSSPPTGKFASREHRGRVETALNGERAHGPACTEPVEVQVLGPTSCGDPRAFTFMNERVVDRADGLEERMQHLSMALQKDRAGDAPEVVPLQMASQHDAAVVGRICCDSEGRLNRESLVLEGLRVPSEGKVVRLDAREIGEFSFFPGQVVLAEGVNPTGTHFRMRKYVAGAAAPKKELPASSGSVTMMVASGPFTTIENDKFQPLEELLLVARETVPSVLVLVGPFVEEEHQPGMDSTYTDMFQATVSRMLRRVLAGLPIRTVLVPSIHDAHHPFGVLPQPPFVPAQLGLDKETTVCTPNPAIVQVGPALTVGVTSVDTLLALSAEEISFNASDRLGRLCRHLIDQQSFFPLFPNPIDVPVTGNKAHRRGLDMPIRPDVLIVPSNLKFFAKRIDGTICINPGRLAKGATGGTYARITVDGPLDDARVEVIRV